MKIGCALISMRNLSPTVTIANVPGIDCDWLGAYRFALPIIVVLLRFLNLSPPIAVKAARASSTGVLLSVIAGGAGMVLVSLEVLPLVLAASGVWANEGDMIRKNMISVRAYGFIADSLRPIEKVE